MNLQLVYVLQKNTKQNKRTKKKEKKVSNGESQTQDHRHMEYSELVI